jgi:tRNA (guanine6-N2)-methyltransferase
MTERVYARRIYAAHTAPGLESLAWEEIQAELRQVSLLKKAGGLLLFNYEGAVGKLLTSLSITEDVFAVIHYTEALDGSRKGLAQLAAGLNVGSAFEVALAAHREAHPRQVRRVTYRVIAQKAGEHAFRRVDAQETLIKAINARYGRWKLVDEDAHLEVWLGIQGRLAVSMIRLSDRTMRHRRYKLAHIPASLRPTIAAAMVFLSAPQADDVFLDGMCGAGTILVERANSAPARLILGGDLDAEALKAAQANADRFPAIRLFRWDAARLPLAAGAAHKAVTNLPFGKQIGSPQGNEALYRAYLAELGRVLTPQGRAVLLSSERELMERALKESAFRARRRVGVIVLGQRAEIFVLERKSR